MTIARRLVGGRGRLVAASAAVVLVAVGGLAAAMAWSVQEETARAPAAGPVITPVAAMDAYPAALVRGTLELWDGCLFLGEALALMPAGTTWDASRAEVRLPSGRTVAVDEHVELGGGTVGYTDAIEESLDAHSRRQVERCSQAVPSVAIALISPG